MSTRTRDDWILWGSVGCALVGTAHSEWSLAVAAGAHPWVAVVVPGALDLYVLRALRVHRDVFLAVLAMVAANVSWYLVHSGDLPVDWPLRSAVGALAPLVLWRVHSLKYTRTRTELLWGPDAGAGAGSAPAPEAAPAVPDHVPDSWMQVEYPETYPGAPVPALPPEYSPVSAPHPEPEVPGLPAGDAGYVALAQEYVATTAAPSVRGLKGYAGVGQARADRLLKHLGVKP